MNTMSSVQILKCRKCGAPAYADQKSEGFLCPYCGDISPWAQTLSRYTPRMVFRHRPIQIVDGLLKMTHVGMPETEFADPRGTDEMSVRMSETDSRLHGFDARATNSWARREMIMIPCANCGATVTGYSTQNIFECGYCKNKIMDAETFKDGAYRKEVFGYDKNIHKLALPFTVSADEAKQQILKLASDNPREFAKQDIEKRLETDLQALYLPYRIWDMCVKATAETEKGDITFYHSRVNWALPDCTMFDIYLMDSLHPWDFGDAAPLAPAFMEGDVRLFAFENNEARNTAMHRMLYRDVPDMVRSAFRVNKVKLKTWTYDFRKHRYAFINLPIWFLDKRSGDGDLQVRAAVNGQTGKASVLFLQKEKTAPFFLKSEEKDLLRTREGSKATKMSCECTMYSPLRKISYVKSPFLYRIH